MIHDWPPPRRERRWTELCRRLDRLAEWVNPVLLAVAAVLLVIDLSLFAAAQLPRLPLLHDRPSPAAAASPPGHIHAGAGKL